MRTSSVARRFFALGGLVATLVACEGEGQPTGPMAVYDIQPRAGATAGEQPVQITGANFRQDIGYSVYFGSLRAAGVTILDNGTLLVATPQHEAGVVNVTVAADSGPAFEIANAFTFADQGGNVMQQVGQPGQQGAERF